MDFFFLTNLFYNDDTFEIPCVGPVYFSEKK